MNSGAADRNRTGDLRITNALLYRLSYSGSTPGYPGEEPYSSNNVANVLVRLGNFARDLPKNYCSALLILMVAGHQLDFFL